MAVGERLGKFKKQPIDNLHPKGWALSLLDYILAWGMPILLLDVSALWVLNLL